MRTFAQLFKKYRLRAEFETFSSFGDALSAKGYFYEESIFSHWQKGKRVPHKRELVLAIIEIFIEKEAVRTIDEANEILESAGFGYLTDKEENAFAFVKHSESPFQVPSDIAYFTGRKELLKKIQISIKKGKIIVLHGPPGVGKTALAIRLGHLLHDQYSDGVLWYKVDSSNEMDILLSIARLFGEDISSIKDVEVRASIVRTLINKKKVLFIFDNVTKNDKLHLLLPSTASSGVIFSSRESTLPFREEHIVYFVNLFDYKEALALFEKVFTEKYVAKNKKVLLAISDKVGYLPLALNIAATQIKQFTITPQAYIEQLDEGAQTLQSLKYEDQDMLQVVEIGFHALPVQEQLVFCSLGIFEGKDFSLESIAFINKFSMQKTEQMLQHLLDISFIDKSKVGRYRIHPLLKVFAREQISDRSLYIRAASFFEQQLITAQENGRYRALTQDVDNIIYIFKKCYDYGYWDQIITLWNPLEKFLSDTNEIKKLRLLMETIDTSPRVNKVQIALAGFYAILFIYWVILFVSGQKQGFWNDFYNFDYSFIPLFSGAISLARLKPWGLLKSNIGKAIFFAALGLFLWGVGNCVWAYYNFFQKVVVPYPSWADAGYAPAYICWLISVIYFSFATGSRFGLRRKGRKLYLLFVPIIIILSSYYFLFFVVKRSYSSEIPIHIFFDLYYPSMDIIIITIATIIFGLSVNFFGGKYRLSLFSILASFVCLYIGDFLFTYSTSINTDYNGGIGDLVYTTSLYLLSWGTLSFYLIPRRVKV